MSAFLIICCCLTQFSQAQHEDQLGTITHANCTCLYFASVISKQHKQANQCSNANTWKSQHRRKHEQPHLQSHVMSAISSSVAASLISHRLPTVHCYACYLHLPVLVFSDQQATQTSKSAQHCTTHEHHDKEDHEQPHLQSHVMSAFSSSVAASLILAASSPRSVSLSASLPAPLSRRCPPTSPCCCCCCC
jgi:hypothetical protein